MRLAEGANHRPSAVLIGGLAMQAKRAMACMSFVVVFLVGFVLGGWFLMPHLPPTPDRPVTVFEADYWTTNWAGALLGLVLGALSARSTLKSKPRQDRE